MHEGRDLLRMDEYNRPKTCEKCDGVMVFMGVGEYQCEDCGAIAYDDYGKVRLYIEGHRGATCHQKYVKGRASGGDGGFQGVFTLCYLQEGNSFRKYVSRM